jgi:hypothetical protein
MSGVTYHMNQHKSGPLQVQFGRKRGNTTVRFRTTESPARHSSVRTPSCLSSSFHCFNEFFRETMRLIALTLAWCGASFNMGVMAELTGPAARKYRPSQTAPQALPGSGASLLPYRCHGGADGAMCRNRDGPEIPA